MMKKLLLLVGLVVFLTPMVVSANEFDPKQLVGKKFKTTKGFNIYCRPSNAAEYKYKVYPNHIIIEKIKGKYAKISYSNSFGKYAKIGSKSNCKNKGKDKYIKLSESGGVKGLLEDNNNYENNLKQRKLEGALYWEKIFKKYNKKYWKNLSKKKYFDQRYVQANDENRWGQGNDEGRRQEGNEGQQTRQVQVNQQGQQMNIYNPIKEKILNRMGWTQLGPGGPVYFCPSGNTQCP